MNLMNLGFDSMSSNSPKISTTISGEDNSPSSTVANPEPVGNHHLLRKRHSPSSGNFCNF